jgi:hypothetical protein
MKLCCETLTELADNADEAGLSVTCHADSGYRWIRLVARACRLVDEGKLAAIPREADVPRPLRVETQIGIAYCPFCGTRLADFIATNQSEFDRQARSS